MKGSKLMAKLLYIESSPRKSRSKSIRVAEEFLAVYKNLHPEDSIEKIDLWSKQLPEFNGFTIDAKYSVLHGQDHTDVQANAWQSVVDVCDQFKSADKYLFSVPMWNFGIPYKLKHYIDVIAQPGQTFSFDPSTGYSGLVTGKPAVVAYARGGAYGEGQAKAMDMQMQYLDMLLRFIGFENIHNIFVEPTLGASEDVAQIEAAAVEKAKEIAAKI